MSDELWAVYDRMGADFERYAADSVYNAHYDRPAVLAALGQVKGLHVLDAGCGPGLYAAELMAAGARVTAFDASQVMTELTRARTAGRAQVDVATLGEPLPYPVGAFDVAVCALAIHHVDDRRAAFAELFRVLRPGGTLVVSTAHPFMDWLLKGGSYFETKLETDVWQLAGGEYPVSFWREPLSALCGGATGAGFLIAEVIEPTPAASMRERDPKRYERLSAEPGFLLLRLVKPC